MKKPEPDSKKQLRQPDLPVMVNCMALGGIRMSAEQAAERYDPSKRVCVLECLSLDQCKRC